MYSMSYRFFILLFIIFFNDKEQHYTYFYSFFLDLYYCKLYWLQQEDYYWSPLQKNIQ